MLQLILFFLFSHILSFFCSMLETVLLSCHPSYIALLKKRGDKTGSQLEELKIHIDRPLSAILTFNTVAQTVGAAGVGAGVVSLYGDQWLALGSIIITFTMLYWGEMLPKTLGALYWKALAPHIVRPIKWLMVMSYPFVIYFNYFARLLAKGKKAEKITDEDIRIALEAGAKAGVIEEAEHEMVENIFRLGDRRVGMLMVPRIDMEWIDVDCDGEKVIDKVISSTHSYFPICDHDVDKVVGVISSREILERALTGKKIELREMAAPPLFINEHSRIFELMDLFKREKSTLAMVTDEYGTIQGMIQLSDIFGAIIRDIDGVGFEGTHRLVPLGGGTFLLDGKMPIDEFKEIFHIEHLPYEEKGRYRTLSGLSMALLESIPKKGDRFLVGELRLEVLKVRKRRVEKILLTKPLASNTK